jgi:aminoglycoside phosphotransferase family enzyme/predicted kinase
MASDGMPALIHSLATPAAFPFPVAEVEVHQTHISAVFLGGPTAYKVKKPINLGFLDFSTLEQRRHFCEEEVRLNRRLAPLVYQGVVPIAATQEGLRFEAVGPVVEWAVKMVRMSPEMDLEHRLARGEVSPGMLRSLANRLADFHRSQPSNELIARQARWAVVADNALSNLDAAKTHVALTLSAEVFERLSARTRHLLDQLRPLIERRAATGVPRDTHGDLRVDHVYWFPENPSPDDWCILDCIEFNERFRYADPVADIAFLVMDLAFRGRWDLARQFADAYFLASQDEAGRELLPLYASYRAAVRAKVDGILLAEAEISEAEKFAAQLRARAHWLSSLAWIEPAELKPRVVLLGGLPGSGKSTLARALAERLGGTLLRSDVVRKALAGLPETDRLAAGFGEGIHTPAWNDRTYQELERRSEGILWSGGRVLIDASFREDARRARFLEFARRWGVPVIFLHCEVEPAVAKARMQQRQGDASDADWAVYEVAAKRWEPYSAEVTRIAKRLNTDQSVEKVTDEAWNLVTS